ncbi:MAG: hypothetical protein Kow00114_15810 [Kiloniellaceae bacterium]
MFAPATNHSVFHVFDELGHALGRIAAAFVGAQEAARVYGALSRLSDSQLAARGLAREDIGRMTLQALDNATDR